MAKCKASTGSAVKGLINYSSSLSSSLSPQCRNSSLAAMSYHSYWRLPTPMYTVLSSVQCNAWHRTDIKSRECMSVCVSVRPSVLTFPFDHSFLSDLSQIWNLGRTSDKEGQVPWLVTPEVVNTYTRQFTNLLLVGLAHFRLVFTTALPFFLRL